MHKVQKGVLGMNQKGVIYLICQSCFDSYYPGHPDGIAFETRAMAEKYLDDNYPDDLWNHDGHYITEIKLFA
jgi:hypothetical protein